MLIVFNLVCLLLFFCCHTGTDEWNYMNRSCSAKLQDQINKEFDAAIFYMQYGAYFAQYQVNLPGS